MRSFARLLVAAALGLGLAAPAAAVVEMSCDAIVGKMEEAGGSVSVDEMAKKLGVTPERIRECMAKTGGGKPSMVNPNPAAGGAGSGKAAGH